MRVSACFSLKPHSLVAGVETEATCNGHRWEGGGRRTGDRKEAVGVLAMATVTGRRLVSLSARLDQANVKCTK